MPLNFKVPIFDVKNINFSAHSQHILSNISLQIYNGEYIAIIGPNGGGKTTLIRMLLGLDHPTSGEIKLYGKKIRHFKSWDKIGYVPQRASLVDENFPATVEDIVKMGRTSKRSFFSTFSSEDKRCIEDSMIKMDVLDLRDKMVGKLSGGQRQRVMIARALASKPEILILDEPTAGVDVEIRRSMWTYLKELNREGMTIILTTHYLEEAESLCRNIAILNEGEVVEQTSMKKLLSKVAHQVIILESVSSLPEQIKEDGFECERLDDYSLQVVLDSDNNITNVLQNLAKQGVSVDHVRSAQNRLETLFLRLTQKQQSEQH